MNSRDETIKRIRAALRKRSGRPWSVTGGRGTAWGWIEIDAPPRRRNKTYVLPEGAPDVPDSYIPVEVEGLTDHSINEADKQTLRDLLGLDFVHDQGVSIPASSDYYQEYIDRAEGRKPSKVGKPYWD